MADGQTPSPQDRFSGREVMSQNPTPRQAAKNLLQSIAPSRPLFLPIVFSLGAKIENLSFRAFLSNATKICNSLKQIRSHLRSDGVACYFDPYLEAEALSGTVQRRTDDPADAAPWPHKTSAGELPRNLHSPEEIAKHGRVNVGVEVIKRLKSLLRDDVLLFAGVTGPFTLAAQLLSLPVGKSTRRRDLLDDAVDLAAVTITLIASKLVEAGANAIFIREEILPPLTTESCEAWASFLAPTVNIVRFYEALPVLQITDSDSFAVNSSLILQQNWDCVMCPTLPPDPNSWQEFVGSSTTQMGIGLPSSFQWDESAAENYRRSLDNMIERVLPVLITTTEDVPASTDVKQVSKIWDQLHR